MKGKLLKTFASSAVALSMLVGCSSGSGTAATELKEGDTVKIGLNYELSGAVASYGQAEYKGASLAIKEYNANKDSKYKRVCTFRGGILTISFFYALFY